MATYLLVHGGFYGGWCWRHVKAFLENAGHKVYTPTMTGLGERKHLVSKEIGIDVHIEDVKNVILYENLTEVNLIGHSYGGLIIASVASQIPDRIKQLIYIDALIPQTGDSLLSLVDTELAKYFIDSANSQGDGWLIPAFLISENEYSKENVSWCNSMVTEQSLKSFSDKISVNEEIHSQINSSYIYCTKSSYPMTKFLLIAKAKNFACYHFEIDHLPMISAPKDLSDLILTVANE